MIDVESDFVLVPRTTTFVMSRTLTYRRPGNLLYRLFAALVGEYEVEETTVFVTESPVADLSLCSSVFLLLSFLSSLHRNVPPLNHFLQLLSLPTITSLFAA